MSETQTASPAPEEVTMVSGISALMPFARGAAGTFAVSGAIAALATLLGLVPFFIIYRSVEEVVAGDPLRTSLWGLAAIAFVAIVARFAFAGLATFVSHVAAYRMLYQIRIGIAEHLTQVPLGYVTRRRTGELKKVMADDVERLELFLAHGLPDAVAAFVTLVALAVWMSWVDWRMAIAALSFVVPAFVCMGFAMRRASPNMAYYQSTLAEMNASIVELVRGMPVVKLFNRGSEEVRGTEEAIRTHVAFVRKYSEDFLPLGTAFYVLLAANVLAIAPLGGWLWSQGELSTTHFLFFLIVGLGALTPMVSLLHLFANLSHLSSGGDLVRDIMNAAVLEPGSVATAPKDASIALENVSFGYDEDRRVLSNISFDVAPGTLTALVGPSGSGKSTIAALIARFWDVDEGSIEIGGVPVRELSADTLSKHVSVVFQDTFLFDDTIAGNLRVGRPSATQAEIEAAARAAQAHDFVVATPDGYETRVGEHGVRFSGGERQRLAIARAILADTPIILLDEATAFADPENESALQEAIGELVRGKTVLVIAHRLSTVVGAHQILVLDDGRIVERGDHDQLVAQGGLYAALWNDFNSAEALGLRGEAPPSEDAV